MTHPSTLKRVRAELKQRFITGAKDVLEKHGIVPLPSDAAVTDEGPFGEYWALTRYGRLEITLYDDWLACRFSRPGLGAPTSSNGKWNFHCFDIDQSPDPKAEAVDLTLAEFALGLRSVKAGRWRTIGTLTTSVAQLDEAVAGQPMDIEWHKDQEALGWEVVIRDLDQAWLAGMLENWQVPGHPLSETERFWARRQAESGSALSAYQAMRGWTRHPSGQAAFLFEMNLGDDGTGEQPQRFRIACTQAEALELARLDRYRAKQDGLDPARVCFFQRGEQWPAGRLVNGGENILDYKAGLDILKTAGDAVHNLLTGDDEPYDEPDENHEP